jgi:imidazolonepropionase-like amidohydrolase
MDATLGYREELHDALDTSNLCNGADDCRRAVREQVARGADVIKFASTGGVNSRIGAGLGSQLFDDEALAIVQTAHMYGKKVAAHAHGADGIALALRAGVDSIEHGTLLDKEDIALFRKSGAWYVPTLSTINGYKERLAKNPDAYTGEVRRKIEWRIGITGKALEAAVPAGVKIAFGTDAGCQHARAQRRRVRADGRARHDADDGDPGGDGQCRGTARPARRSRQPGTRASVPTSSPWPAIPCRT